MQDWNTNDMIFDVPTLIEFLSGSKTLLPGTVILTGTPHGVGFARTPPVFLQPGDTVTIDIEGIGALTNPVTLEKPDLDSWNCRSEFTRDGRGGIACKQAPASFHRLAGGFLQIRPVLLPDSSQALRPDSTMLPYGAGGSPRPRTMWVTTASRHTWPSSVPAAIAASSRADMISAAWSRVSPVTVRFRSGQYW